MNNRPTCCPGWNNVPRCLTIMFPGLTNWSENGCSVTGELANDNQRTIPENFFKPRRFPGEPPWLFTVPPARFVAFRIAPVVPFVRRIRYSFLWIRLTKRWKWRTSRVKTTGQEGHVVLTRRGQMRQALGRLSPKCLCTVCLITRLLSLSPSSLQTTKVQNIMVLLVTSDNEQFNADKEVVERSVLIKNMLEGMCSTQCCVW